MPITAQVLSDLHAELNAAALPSAAAVATGADIVVLAGDVARARDEVEVAVRLFPETSDLVVVGGNHSHYRTDAPIDLGIDIMRRAATALWRPERRIHVLEDEAAILDVRGTPVRVLGCTLWTDYALFGDARAGMLVCKQAIADHRMIEGRDGSALRPEELAARHARSRHFLASELSRSFSGPTIVATHHLPSMRSVAARYRATPLSAGFASNLDDLVGMGSTLWVHGHTHDPALWRDETSGTLVVCNPAGYAAGNGIRENRAFDPKLVIGLAKVGEVWRAEMLREAEPPSAADAADEVP